MADRQPALTQVNKQVRAESLPVYYGENQILLIVGRPSLYSWIWGGDEYIRRYDRFMAMMGTLPGQPGTNTFRLIKKVFVLVYGERGDIGFRMSATDAPRKSWEVQICSTGSESSDWADDQAIRAALMSALEASPVAASWPAPRDWTSRQRIFVQTAVDLVCCIAKECPMASKNVYLSDSRF